MAKKLGSYRLSDEAFAIIETLAERDDRSAPYIVDKAIKLLGVQEGVYKPAEKPKKKKQ